MKNIIELICSRKPAVVWNPFEDNDTLTKDEFLNLTKARGYSNFHFSEEWITAYQPNVRNTGYETIDKYLKEAIELKLNIYFAILEDEKINSTSLELVRVMEIVKQ